MRGAGNWIGGDAVARNLVYALVVVLALGLPGIAAADVGNAVTVEPVDFHAYSTCSGESIHVVGVRRTTETVVYDSAGGIHIQEHSTVVATGYSAGGSKYVVTHQMNSFENSRTPGTPNPGSAYTYMEKGEFKLIGSGPDNNTIIRGVLRFTITPDGTGGQSFIAEDVICRG